MKIDFNSTLKDSLLEGFFPEGWDMVKINECCSHAPEEIFEKQDFWNEEFKPVMCKNIVEFNAKMGYEIAMEIKSAKEKNIKLALILPVGPMGMYEWTVYFLKSWNLSCEHVTCFNMDEWADKDGNTLDSSDPASFQYSMEQAFYNPLGELTVPVEQRNFATKENLPTYPEKIAKIKEEGGRLVTVYGIGRMCHIAFWEPMMGAEFDSDEEWKKQTYRLGMKLHPMTIEQNAITSFKSRIPLVPCTANTIGPGLFLQSDRMIGGADGALSRGMQWQGMSLWMTLRFGPDRHVTSSYIPTIPGTLFFLEELAGPLAAECN